MGNIRNITETARKFLLGATGREFLTFLFFLAFSTIFWLIITFNETYEKEVAIPVKVVNVPNNVVLTSDDTDTIHIMVEDKGLVLIGYLDGLALSPIEIDFRKYATGTESGIVPAADLLLMVTERLQGSTKVKSITPETEEFFFNYGLSKRVPVKWTGHVRPNHPNFIAKERIVPDSVDIYASQRLLDSISVVYTEQLNCDGFKDTLTVDAQLQHGRDVKVLPGKVTITFVTDILTEEEITDIPIRGINVPGGKTLRTFPSKATVRFVTGITQLRKLSKNDFEVVVDYNEIVNNPSARCKVRLTKSPDNVSRATLDITEADYLIEE